MASLKDDLSKIVQGEVMDDDASLLVASRDASLFEVRPQVVVAPKDVTDLKALVNYTSEHAGEHVSLTVRSGATDMTGGPINDSVILDVAKHFNRVIEVGKDYAITQPGVFYRDFEKATLAKDLLMPSYPASREICTVGGMVSNNSGGEKTLSYGKTIDYVRELKAVLADGNEYTFHPLTVPELEAKKQLGTFEGEVYRKMHALIESKYDQIRQARPNVHKNSAGYNLWDVWDRHTFDMTKVLVGSQGTLGIISEIQFRLIHPKKHSKLLVIFLNDLRPLAQVIQTVLHHKPETFESYDDNTLKIALRFLPNLVKMMGAKNLFSLALSFMPEALLTLRNLRLPRLILMAEFTGNSEKEIDATLVAVQHDLAVFKLAMRVTQTEQEAKKYWTIRRESFNLLRNHVKGMRTAPFIDDIIVRPEALPDFLPRLQELLKPYKLLYTIAGHAGDGNFHIIPLVKANDPTLKTIIPELSKKVYDLVMEFHGSITAEHNDGLVRSAFLKQMYGPEIYELFVQAKKIFDPKNIFNPGKKTNSSFVYAMEHLRKS